MENIEKMLPEGKFWFSLSEVCVLKNLNYKTVCNRPWLQPTSEKIGGRKQFRRDVVAEWLGKSDEQLIEEKSR